MQVHFQSLFYSHLEVLSCELRNQNWIPISNQNLNQNPGSKSPGNIKNITLQLKPVLVKQPITTHQLYSCTIFKQSARALLISKALMTNSTFTTTQINNYNPHHYLYHLIWKPGYYCYYAFLRGGSVDTLDFINSTFCSSSSSEYPTFSLILLSNDWKNQQNNPFYLTLTALI